MPVSRLVLLLVALALGGCGGDNEATSTVPASSIAAPTSTEGSSRCLPADSNLMTPLGNGMKDDQVRLTNGRAVKSDDHANVYFVSAEVYWTGRR